MHADGLAPNGHIYIYIYIYGLTLKVEGWLTSGTAGLNKLNDKDANYLIQDSNTFIHQNYMISIWHINSKNDNHVEYEVHSSSEMEGIIK